MMQLVDTSVGASSQVDLVVPDEAGMEAVGRCLAKLMGNHICFLAGPLGAGKTTLVRGCLRALGYQGAVKSPTYTLVETYDVALQQIFHFDLYRLGGADDLENMGLRDYLSRQASVFIEWPERGELNYELADLAVNIEYLEPAGRRVSIGTSCSSMQNKLSELRDQLEAAATSAFR